MVVPSIQGTKRGARSQLGRGHPSELQLGRTPSYSQKGGLTSKPPGHWRGLDGKGKRGSPLLQGARQTKGGSSQRGSYGDDTKIRNNLSSGARGWGRGLKGEFRKAWVGKMGTTSPDQLSPARQY